MCRDDAPYGVVPHFTPKGPLYPALPISAISSLFPSDQNVSRSRSLFSVQPLHLHRAQVAQVPGAPQGLSSWPSPRPGAWGAALHRGELPCRH
jgi:hypothetical protein